MIQPFNIASEATKPFFTREPDGKRDHSEHSYTTSVHPCSRLGNSPVSKAAPDIDDCWVMLLPKNWSVPAPSKNRPAAMRELRMRCSGPSSRERTKIPVRKHRCVMWLGCCRRKIRSRSVSRQSDARFAARHRVWVPRVTHVAFVRPNPRMGSSLQRARTRPRSRATSPTQEYCRD